MAKLKRAAEAVSQGMAPNQVWKDFVLNPDLKGVSTQAAAGGPLNLVPPVDFESTVWLDDSARCKRKAELRAEGYEVPKTLEDFHELEAQIKVQVAEQEAATRRLRAINDPQEQKDPAFGPRQIRRIRQASAYLQSYMGRLSFFTGTLSPWHLERVAWCPNGWGLLTTNFRRALSQKCRRRGLPDYALDVSEIQMERYEETGEIAPHIHLVFVCKVSAGYRHQFLVSKEELQLMWDSAIHSVIGECSLDIRNRTKTVAVEKDVFGYLRKYFSKGSETDGLDWSLWLGAKPKQWCSVSGGLRKAMKAVSPEVNGIYMEWLNVNAKNFQGRGFYHFKEWCPDEMPVGALGEVQFYSAEAASACFIQFVDDTRRALAFGSGLPYEKLDPVAALGLPVPSADLERQMPRTFPVSGVSPVTQDLRERLDILFVNSQIPEPILSPLSPLLEKEGVETQLELFRDVSRAVLECHLGGKGDDN